jgi:hypothetical protein
MAYLKKRCYIFVLKGSVAGRQALLARQRLGRDISPTLSLFRQAFSCPAALGSINSQGEDSVEVGFFQQTNGQEEGRDKHGHPGKRYKQAHGRLL